MVPQFKKSLSVMSALGLVAIVGTMDHLTGNDLSFLLFYLIPIFQVTWFVGRLAGIAVSCICALVWFYNHSIAMQSTASFSLLWNTSIRFGIFIIVTYIISIQAALKRALEHEKSSARTDFLTGALNSRAFAEQAEHEIARLKRYGNCFSIAYIDLDNFKSVNDTFGHTAGDCLLKTVVEVLQRNVRSTDFIARLGGDEFAILQAETDDKGAVSVVNKCQHELAQQMKRSGWPVTASIGVATFLEPPESVDVMLREVDRLMYKAKDAGKNAITVEIFSRREKLRDERPLR